MLKVIVFNGPPRSAKGEAAKYMVNTINDVEGFLPAYQREFKDELFKIAASILDITTEEFLTDYDRQTPDKVWWMKDLASLSTTASMLHVGEKKVYSQREWLIHVSENVIKPFFGQDAFGQMAANSLPEEGVVFFSDSGFTEELRPIIEKVGEENVLVVRLHREGCTFEGDSRDYLQPEMFDNHVKFQDLENNTTLEEFFVKVEDTIGRWMND